MSYVNNVFGFLTVFIPANNTFDAGTSEITLFESSYAFTYLPLFVERNVEIILF